ncbi:uncharacterized protein LOC110971259 [Acanthochromis polyacanthus]|uniref:uncharacterized protein LOC110971259 n=1 Tax=Acanthochromis polyacanthus TaxID=80966 RepID=UPI0022347624|nr:uncharacterized protein LOC110971259 [Acanthochromis polyacanthus]XP_051799932.1 uncharacterized protein LOC110971259 [Acanthochromis polyacanthus]XP_051799933.1 uncharacterized protein LOC110971259 [Acanthochromis polyacanthus]
MSHPLYNPYASGNQNSSQGQYGHSSVPPERDPRRTPSHLGPGSNFSSSGVSSATSANSGGTIPSLLSLPVTYIPKQRRPVLDEEIEGSVDMHISRAREEVRHQPVSQDSRFTGPQTGRFASSSTGGISYPTPSTSQGQRHTDVESGSSSLDWLQDYKRATEDDSSRFYSTSASCSFPSSDDSRFDASSGRERGMQSIPGLGDYDYPGPDKLAAPTESSRPKYTSESAANILLHFGLEKEDLEHLISFPENQITPDNLPFILRQIRIQKAKKGTTADQSKPYPEPQPATSMSSSRGAGMHLNEMSSTVLQPSKVIDYGHTSKYTGGVGDEIGRTSDSRENSGSSGSMFQMNPYSGGSHKSGTSVPSHDHWASGASLSSSYSSMQSSATPPSSDPTKRLKTQPDQTSQTSFSFPMPKKDTDIRLFKTEIPNPLVTKELKSDNQQVSKTEPSGTLVRGGNTNRPGILRVDGHDKSSSKDQSSTKGQGLKVTEQIQKQQMQPKQSEPQLKQLGQLPKQLGQLPKQLGQLPKQLGQLPKQLGQLPKQLGQLPKQLGQLPKQLAQQQPVKQQQPVLQMGQTLQPQGFPAPRLVPPPSFIPSSSSTSHSILPPVFVGVPRPLVTPPALPQPVPGLMNFLPMQMPTSSNQRAATGEVSRNLPSASMMHDYAAASPRIFPHTCTLCNKECSQMKDWISHQNTSIHLENCKLLRKRYPQWDGEVPSLPRAPRSDAKPSPSSSAQTYQERHQRSSREIPSRSRSSRSRSRSYSPCRHHGSESRRNRRSSRSRSRSYSPRRYYGSESRREKRSRSRSPYSSRYTRRSRSNSPRYDRPTSSRYRSRSRSHERRSSPRRRDEKRRERRSSSERSSPRRKRSSSTDMLTKKLLQTTAVQSLSSQSDLETVVKTLAPALLAELTKMKSSSSSSKKELTTKKAKSSLQKSEVDESLPPNEVRLHGVRTSQSHSDVVAAVEQFGKTKSVVLFRSKLEAIVRFENVEDAEKLKSLKSIEIKGMPVIVIREEKSPPKKPLPSSAKKPTKPLEQKSTKSTQSTRSTNAGKSSSLPSAADRPKIVKLVAKAKVLVSKAKNQPTKQTVKKTKTGKVTAKGAVKSVDVKKGASKVVGSNKLNKPVKKPDAGVSEKEPEPKTSETSAKESVVAPDGETNNAAASAVKPVAELSKPVAEAKEVKSSESLELGETGVVEPMEVASSTEGKGEKVTDTKPLPTKSSETHPPSTVQTASSVSSPEPPTDPPEKPQPAVTTPETSVKAPSQIQQDTKPDPKSPAPETKTEALQTQQQTATGSAEGVDTKTNEKDAVTTQKDAAPTVGVSSSSTEAAAPSSPPVAKLTMGDEIEKHLLKERIPILKMEKLQNNKLFKLNYKVLLVSNLPKYTDGRYTEQDIADLLVPFGFQYHKDSIYVVPQTGMAFVMMPTVQEVKNIMRPAQKREIFLHGSKISVEVVKQYIFFEPIDFYKSLMKLMHSQPVLDKGTRTVFIRNISQSETKDLREALKKICSVRNFLPLLNKVFVEFDSIRDADRLGVWFSLLKQTHNYKLLRLEIPRSAITAQPPRLAANALPDSKDIVAGATIPTTRSGVPHGSTAPFWVTMKTSPFVFPTTSPWFIIPNYQTVDVAQDVGICSGLGMKFYTLMLTGLPEGNYSQEDVAKLVWSYFPKQNLHWLYYNVTVLTLQRRAFVYFSSWQKCREFIRDHIKSPASVNDCTLKVHIVLEDIRHGSSEEVMYRNLMKWSNAHVPELESLEDRLLSVEISETNMDLIMLVMHLVSSIAPFISFLPLANRILIEMSEPSGVTKVVESASQHHLTAMEAWSKVQRIETLKSLKQRLQDSSEIIINLGLDATDVSSSLPAVSCEAQPPPLNPDSAVAAVGSESITAAPADVEMKDSEEKPAAQVTVDSRIPPEDVKKEVMSENESGSEVTGDSRIPPKEVKKEVISENEPGSEVTVDCRILHKDVETSEKKPSAEVTVDSRILPENTEKEVKKDGQKPSAEVTVDSRIPPENMEKEKVKKDGQKPSAEVTVDSRIPPENMEKVEVKDGASAAASVWSADGNTVAAASSSDPSATREVKTQEAELPPINEDVFKVIAAAVRQHRLALRGETSNEDREVQSPGRNSTSSRSVKNKDTARGKDPSDFTADVVSSDFFSFDEQSFNLEDFVTVDEIVEDDQSSSSSRRTSREGRGRESSDAAKQTSTRSSKDSKSSASSSCSSSKPTKASVRSSSSSSSKSASPKRHQDSSKPSRSHIKPSAAGRTSAEPPVSSGHRAQPSSTKSPARASQSSSSGRRTRSAKTAAGSHQSHREEEKPTESAAARSDHQVSAESAAAKTVESETETEASSEMLPPAQRQESEVTSRTQSLQNESLREEEMSKERKKEEADKHTEEEEEEEDYQILDSVEEQTDEQTTEENPDEAQSEQRLDDGVQQVLDRVEEEGGARPEEGNASVRVLESITEDQEAAAEDDQHPMEVKQPTDKNPSRAVDSSDKSAAEDSADQNQDTRSRKSARSGERRTRDQEMPSEESCKAFKDAGGSPDSKEKPPKGRDDKDASTDVSEQGTFEILDSVEDQTSTEGDDQKPPSEQKPTGDTTTEEDLFQVIDSVEDQTETESESNNKERRTKRGEASATKRDERPSRRTPRTRTSRSEDKEKSPKKADRTVRKHETGTKDSTAGKDKKEDKEETLKKTVDSVDGASTTERSGRRRSTRGNKEEKKTPSHTEATEKPDREEEITYEILDSVEDEAAVDEPTVSTRSTRGRSQRTSRKEASNATKDDTRRRRTPARGSQKPNEEKAAAKERTPTKKKSGAGEEEATYEILDSVEDDQPTTGGKPRRGRPKKDVKTAKKPNKAAAADEEEEEEDAYQVLDSVGDETVDDQRHTDESKSPVCEDDGRKTKKSSTSLINEEEEEPMYQIVDSLEDDQEEKTNTEESDRRTTERSWTKDEDPAAETGDLEPGGTSAAEAVEENLQQTGELHPAAAENKEKSPEPDEASTKKKQEAALESSLNLDEVSEEEEDYPDDSTEEEELKKKQKQMKKQHEERRSREREERQPRSRRRGEGSSVAVTTRMEADGQQLLTLDEVGGDGDGRRPEITEGELQELVTLDEICEEEEGKAELSMPEPRPLCQESQSEASSNPQAADEEEEKTSKSVKRKHEDDDSSAVLEQSVNFVTVDEVGDAEDEEKEETEKEETKEEARTPRTRGRPKKRSRQSAVRKSTRGKTETPEEEGSVDSSAAQSDEPPIQRTEVEAASGAQEEAASAGQQLEGHLEEEEGRSSDADKKRRKQLIGPEAKKPRCQSAGGEFSLPPFSSSTPLGVEFVVPKSGFFCELCSVFYLNEISAKETHCSSQRHYDNLQKHYQKLKQKLSGTQNPQSCD